MEIKIREARLEDKEAILSLLKEVDPNDYIFHVLDDWLSNPSGKMLVAEHDGKIVAVNHILFQKNSGWLEGARVHKDYRNRGIATSLALKSLEILREKGIRKARLATSISNIPAQRHLLKTPFKPLSNWLFIREYEPVAKAINLRSSFEESLRFLERSHRFNSLGRIYHDSYVWFDFDEEWLRKRAELEELHVEEDGIVIVSESERRSGHFSVCYLECRAKYLLEMLSIANFMAKRKNESAELITAIPAFEEYKKVLEEKGIEYREFIVYEANF